MTDKKILYIAFLLICFPLMASGQEENNIHREVKLYNPFKPSLTHQNKVFFSPVLNDTSQIVPDFDYSVTPRVFMPEYTLKNISAARLEPETLPRLYKSFLNLGFGNYFTPLAELSISNERNRNRRYGFYALHNSSFGKVELDNEERVYAGFIDNYATLYGENLFRHSSLSGDIGFNHMRRYLYGYYTDILPVPDTDKDSLKTDYINPSAAIEFASERLDSNHLDYKIVAKYDLLMQNSNFYRHNASVGIDLAYKFGQFYTMLNSAYDLFLFSEAIGDNTAHLVSLSPSINRKSSAWAFKAGLKLNTFSRDELNETSGTFDYKTRIYIYPDIRFSFDVLPSFMRFYVSLDGNMKKNRASDVYQVNPYVLNFSGENGVSPSADLYRINPEDRKLRIGGGVSGNAGKSLTYLLKASYDLFEDMLFFAGDTSYGRTFVPVYDSGELFELHAELNAVPNDKLTLRLRAAYYNYRLEKFEYPWFKPEWDTELLIKYNLRNKIIVKASLAGVSQMYGISGPSLLSGDTDQQVNRYPAHLSFNLKAEYRYTKILSFWTSLNNISSSRYYNYGFYPSQRFLFMAGFTYSM